MRAPTDLPADIPSLGADILALIRARAPRVHCITNAVAQNFSANMLLALGAVPSMTIAIDEIADFVARADALLVNLGTLDPERRAAIELAVTAAESRVPDGVPWVLDPVLVDRSPPRNAFAQALVARRPRALRLNAAEFAALAGEKPTAAALARYATATGSAIGLTGDRDIIVDGARRIAIRNGHELMAKVTAMGCAASAIVAACHAVEPDAWRATAAGLIIVGVAGEVAAGSARGPGSFAVAVLDALHGLDAATIAQRARIER
jgi:hydroxyethylthiazole kinase